MGAWRGRRTAGTVRRHFETGALKPSRCERPRASASPIRSGQDPATVVEVEVLVDSDRRTKSAGVGPGRVGAAHERAVAAGQVPRRTPGPPLAARPDPPGRPPRLSGVPRTPFAAYFASWPPAFSQPRKWPSVGSPSRTREPRDGTSGSNPARYRPPSDRRRVECTGPFRSTRGQRLGGGRVADRRVRGGRPGRRLLRGPHRHTGEDSGVVRGRPAGRTAIHFVGQARPRGVADLVQATGGSAVVLTEGELLRVVPRQWDVGKP